MKESVKVSVVKRWKVKMRRKGDGPAIIDTCWVRAINKTAAQTLAGQLHPDFTPVSAVLDPEKRKTLS
jgi:hypothetical protein